MSMFRFILFPLVLIASCSRPAPDNNLRRPHIVLILADDLGQGDLGCYNSNSRILTPQMDRIAAEGMRFTDAHSPAAVCTPTRYGLLTGRYAWRTRLKSWVLNGSSRALIEPGRPTIATLLAERGWSTQVVGKWHLGLGDSEPVDYSQSLSPGPLAAGFDNCFVIPASLDMEPYVFVVDDEVEHSPSTRIDGSAHRRHGGDGFWRSGRAASGWEMQQVLPRLADEALQRINDHAAQGASQPLFLYFPLSAPHTPWVPTAEWAGTTPVSHYGDFVAQVDGVVGRVFTALEANGMADNTLLIVTSDNGAHWLSSDIEQYGHDANNGWRGQKADIHEGGHRIPFIVRWPGRIPAGVTSSELICLTDLYQTVANLTGESPSVGGEDSFDYSSHFLGARSERPVRDSLVHHSGNGMYAIRQGPWKLISQRGSGGFTRPVNFDPPEGEPSGQLYHLGDDPGESENLWTSNPEVVARLLARLIEIQQNGRSAPLPE